MNRRWRLRFQNQILLLSLIAVVPAWLVAAFFLWIWNANTALRWVSFVLITLLTATAAFAVRGHLLRRLRPIANLLEALREGDYSLRGRSADPHDVLGEVMSEVNALAHTLHQRRLDMMEAGVLLDKVIAEIDIAVFAFDAARQLCLVNRAGEALLGAPADQLLHRGAAELGFAELLAERPGRIVPHVFPGGTGRWEVRHRHFRNHGEPHELLVVTELSRALRDEERQTWKRLVRVIGHELNSSLTPIKSTAGTLRSLTDRDPLPGDWRADVQTGLGIIHDRADALGRFMSTYAKLSRLPPPAPRELDFAQLARRAVSLHGSRVASEGGPEIRLHLDGDQMEQVLINLIKNGVEAVGEGRGAVRVRWHINQDHLIVEVEDDGPGLARTENLWVPFFTTKRGGSGIGLVLSREIVENHGGTLALENRPSAHGCVARICLPIKLS